MVVFLVYLVMCITFYGQIERERNFATRIHLHKASLVYTKYFYKQLHIKKKALTYSMLPYFCYL